MRNLEGLTIVMMGATGGMGTATALRIAKPGVNLAFSSSRGERVRELEEKLSLTGAGVFGAVVDVTDDAQVRDFMQAVYDRFGRVDILINFAGLSITRKLPIMPESLIFISFCGMILTDEDAGLPGQSAGASLRRPQISDEGFVQKAQTRTSINPL